MNETTHHLDPIRCNMQYIVTSIMLSFHISFMTTVTWLYGKGGELTSFVGIPLRTRMFDFEILACSMFLAA